MLTTILGLGMLLVLAVTVLPIPRVRRWLFTATLRFVQAIVLAVLGACGTFFVQPDSAPDWISSHLAPILEGTLGFVWSDTSGWPWLVIGAGVVLLSLPLVLLVELAASLSDQTALVQSLRQELRTAAAWCDRRLAILGYTTPLPTNEAEYAREAIRSTQRPVQDDTVPLVLDLIRKQ